MMVDLKNFLKIRLLGRQFKCPVFKYEQIFQVKIKERHIYKLNTDFIVLSS